MNGPQDPGEKLRIAFELHEAGIALQRCNLKRRHPEADERTIDRLLEEWLLRRPGEAPFVAYVPPEAT